jgi:L-amino acid N-acyltransferase YncA
MNAQPAGQVEAWASAGTDRAHRCHGPVAEHSVSVDREHRDRGIGRIAPAALCAEAERLSFVSDQ